MLYIESTEILTCVAALPPGLRELGDGDSRAHRDEARRRKDGFSAKFSKRRVTAWPRDRQERRRIAAAVERSLLLVAGPVLQSAPELRTKRPQTAGYEARVMLLTVDNCIDWRWVSNRKVRQANSSEDGQNRRLARPASNAWVERNGADRPKDWTNASNSSPAQCRNQAAANGRANDDANMGTGELEGTKGEAQGREWKKKGDNSTGQELPREGAVRRSNIRAKELRCRPLLPGGPAPQKAYRRSH